MFCDTNKSDVNLFKIFFFFWKHTYINKLENFDKMLPCFFFRRELKIVNNKKQKTSRQT